MLAPEGALHAGVAADVVGMRVRVDGAAETAAIERGAHQPHRLVAWLT